MTITIRSSHKKLKNIETINIEEFLFEVFSENLAALPAQIYVVFDVIDRI